MRDPGIYRIRVQAQYAEAVEQEVALNAGDNKHVTLRLVQAPPEKPLDPPPEADGQPPST